MKHPQPTIEHVQQKSTVEPVQQKPTIEPIQQKPIFELPKPRTTPQPTIESPKQDYKDVITVPQNQLPPKIPQKTDTSAKPPLPKIPIMQEPQPIESFSSLSDESETPRAVVKSSESSSEDAESIIVVESPDLNKTLIEPKIPQKTRPAPPPPIVVPQPKPRNKGVDPVELERRLSQELISPTHTKKYDPDLDDVPLSVVPSTLPGITNAEVEIETPSPESYHSSADSNTTYTQEQPIDELERPQILEITDEMLADSDDEPIRRLEQPQPARRSLLGNLPPISLPTPVQRRQSANTGRNVEFTSPLHSSIPR